MPTPLSSEALGETIVAQLAQLGDDLDGIVAASDVIAMMILRALHERGARVPQQIAVVGFDDLPIATSTVPQLTTVRQDIAGGAKAMVGALMQRMAGINAPATILPPELVIRESA